MNRRRKRHGKIERKNDGKKRKSEDSGRLKTDTKRGINREGRERKGGRPPMLSAERTQRLDYATTHQAVNGTTMAWVVFHAGGFYNARYYFTPASQPSLSRHNLVVNLSRVWLSHRRAFVSVSFCSVFFLSPFFFSFPLPFFKPRLRVHSRR